MPAIASPTLKVSQLTLTAATSKIVPGATSLSLRNNADSADNVLISDAGAVTIRSTLTQNGQVQITSTSAGQLTVRYDGSNNLGIDVSSAGLVTYNAAGASAGHSFSDLITATAGLTVSSGQTLTLTGATITGLTAASVAAGTFPAGAFVFAGAVSGVTTLAGSGAVSGFTTLSLSSDIINTSTAAVVRTNTSDATDNATLTLMSAAAASAARGAYVRMAGNEHANVGRVDIVTGDVAGGTIDFYTLGALAAQLDRSTTATHTRLLVYDVDNAALERVTVGAADSGGAGFKVLRIPN